MKELPEIIACLDLVFYDRAVLLHIFFQLDPMSKLRNYMEENNLRLVDFFNQFDQDHSMSVTREEFKTGIEVLVLLFAFFPAAQTEHETPMFEMLTFKNCF